MFFYVIFKLKRIRQLWVVCWKEERMEESNQSIAEGRNDEIYTARKAT